MLIPIANGVRFSFCLNNVLSTPCIKDFLALDYPPQVKHLDTLRCSWIMMDHFAEPPPAATPFAQIDVPAIVPVDGKTWVCLGSRIKFYINKANPNYCCL